MSYQWSGSELQAYEMEQRAILSNDLLLQANTMFNLGMLYQATDLGGTYNLNVLLSSSMGHYVLRVYRPWIHPERLRSIQQTKQALALKGLPIPLPISTSSGKMLALLENRLVEIEPYIVHGSVADNWERYAQSFTLLGSLHNALSESIPSSFVPPRVSNYGLPLQLLRWIENTKSILQRESDLPATTQALAACEQAQHLLLVIDDFWRRIASSLPIQPLHGDYGGGNILFRENVITAILDFDFLAIRERVFELAYTCYWMLRRLEPNRSPDTMPWDKISAMLECYNSTATYPLTTEEKVFFPYEMARVPLYWIAEAGFTPAPLAAVQTMLPDIAFSQWLLAHANDIRNLLM